MYLQNKYTKCYYSIINRAKSRELPKEIYTEKHHTIPKSLGGSNDQCNLVRLTAKEHRLAHILLPRMTIDPAHTKSMWYALWMMLRTKNRHQQRNVSKGSAFNLAKTEVAKNSSQLHKGKVVSDETREKQSIARKGKPGPNKDKPMSEAQKLKMKATITKNGRIITPETVAKILKSRKGYKHSEETLAKMRLNHGRAMLGKHHSVESLAKMSASKKGKIPTWLVGKPAHNRGVAHSKETVAKMKIPKPKFTCPHCNTVVGGQANYNRWHGTNCKNLCNFHPF